MPIQFKDYLFKFHKRGDHLVIYEISDGDESGATKYYGYLSPDGAWIIQKWDTSANTYRYVGGASGYSTNWTNRLTLIYDYFNTL